MVEEKFWPEDALRGAKSFRPNLPRYERLTSWKKRAQIINQGKSIKYDIFYISILPQNYWQLSVVIKKGSGPAHQRNVYKRKIKESYRLCKPHCLYPAAVAITVLRKPLDLRMDTLKDLLILNINSLLR